MVNHAWARAPRFVNVTFWQMSVVSFTWSQQDRKTNAKEKKTLKSRLRHPEQIIRQLETRVNRHNERWKQKRLLQNSVSLYKKYDMFKSTHELRIRALYSYFHRTLSICTLYILLTYYWLQMKLLYVAIRQQKRQRSNWCSFITDITLT